jgi:signal transduction histidine kinase/CheY-like chemotaxis protein
VEKKKILVVEDERILLDLYTTVLLRQGRSLVYVVEKAETAEQALAAAAKGPFDLVITDYHLPGEDGISLIRQVKTRHPATAFILISGYLSPEVQKSAIAAGAGTCLKKPCSIASILETVEKALCHQAALRPTDSPSPAPEPSPPDSGIVPLKSLLDGIEESALFIDQALRVKTVNARFAEEYAPLKDYVGNRCHELLYHSPFMCPRCPLHELAGGKMAGPVHIEQKLFLGREIIERIDPWPAGDRPGNGHEGMVVSLIARLPEDEATGAPAAKKSEAKDFFVIALDGNGRIVFTDRHFPHLLFLKKPDILSRPITDFLYSYFLQYLAKQETDFMRFAAAHGERPVTLDFVSGKDSVRHPFVCEFIRRDDGFPEEWEMMVIGMDMGRRLELYRLIEFERESLHRLRSGQFDMVITIDKDLKIKTINNACLAKLVAKHRDLVDADFNALLVKSRDRQSFAQGVAQAQTLKDVFNLRLDLDFRGASHPVLVNISAVRDSFNDEIGYVLVLRDIERQLKMEATLRNVERMQALGQLAAGTAHQINNYTNAIMGSSELLHDCLSESLKDQPEASAEALGVLAIVQESIHKLTALTKHLTAFARAQQAPVISAGDVNQVVKETLALVNTHLNKKSIRLETALGERLPPVYFSPLHLEQAVLNIVMNAIDAVEQGRGRITVTTFRDPEWVCISVADNGPGIPEEVRGRMFEAFVTTKPEGVGTGLGLNVARDVVESIKGTIEVDTDSSRGTTMTIKIPILLKGRGVGQ